MTQHASSLAGLSTERRALLEKYLLQTCVPEVEQKRQQRPAKVLRPLSPAQESLWFHDQFHPNSPVYNIPQALRIRGRLDLPALEKTFQAIIGRHEALRMRFTSVDGKPMYLIADEYCFSMPVMDVSVLSDQERSVECARCLDEEFKRPFNLSEDLMVRAVVVKLRPEEHILAITLHHIVSDLSSFVVLNREIADLYNAFVTGGEPTLPELRRQFSDFIDCQRERLAAAATKQHLNYWKQKFEGDLPALELPGDRSRPSVQTFKGLRVHFKYPPAVLQGVKELSRREGVTVYMTLLAAFQTLLHRYTSATDIVVGAPVSERTQTESEKLIGYFISTLPLRLDVGGDPAFREVLKRTQAVVLDAFAHQRVPVEKIIEELRLPRSTDRNSLFQVVFQYLPAPPPGIRLTGAEVELTEVETGTAKFDLTLTLAETSDGLAGNFEYNTDLFDGSRIDRMIAQFETLLGSIIANPAQNIDALPMLPAEEERRVLIEFNQTTTAYPRERCIHELFEEEVARRANAVALVFDGRQMTYDELNRKADELANVLKAAGVKPDALVGFCVERSFEMVVGLLGILKAGGAYVTFDPNYPRERLSYMFNDTNASVFVTTSKFKDLANEGVQVICLDAPLSNVEFPPNAVNQVTAENLAYVIYTSGSTGKPKGVAVPHRAVVRLVRNTNYLSFSEDQVFLQFAPISFDASTLEIWGPLLNGGKLVIFPPEFASLEQLSEIVQREKVTTLWLTAGLFHQMVEHHIGSLRQVRQLLAGGDVLSVPHVMKAQCELPQTTLINGYGPTENTTFTCCYTIPRDWTGGRSVPIGKPISNTQIYVLDARMQPVPIGVPGELFIGGDGLAREYLNAPDLTEQKFVPASNAGDKGKLYRTGDLVRWLPDGNVEFLGRLDFQVKIRGFRVELGEIESALLENPAVRQCLVIAQADSSGMKQVVAYVVPQLNQRLIGEELRTLLLGRLPAHMVPSQFVVMEELPLTANGKVDRKQLPSPQPTESAAHSGAPGNPTEQALVNMWSEVLGVQIVGIHDNFFMLGGHSLLATRVISRIRNAFGIDLPIRALFEAPTIASLAELMSKASGRTSKDVPITRRNRIAASGGEVASTGAPPCREQKENRV